ncbi:MAG: hypothetical protein R3A11_00610 [Bdellovibrionota bacterium]
MIVFTLSVVLACSNLFAQELGVEREKIRPMGIESLDIYWSNLKASLSFPDLRNQQVTPNDFLGRWEHVHTMYIDENSPTILDFVREDHALIQAAFWIIESFPDQLQLRYFVSSLTDDSGTEISYKLKKHVQNPELPLGKTLDLDESGMANSEGSLGNFDIQNNKTIRIKIESFVQGTCALFGREKFYMLCEDLPSGKFLGFERGSESAPPIS